jgi:hypothetical protein
LKNDEFHYNFYGKTVKLKASSFIIVLLDYDSFSLGRKLRRSFTDDNGTAVKNCS